MWPLTTRKVPEAPPVATTNGNGEQHYRRLCDMLSELVYVARVDPATGRVRIEWANEAFVRITGFHKEELELIPTWPMLVHPRDEELAQVHRERVFNGEPSSVTMRIVDSRGRTRHVRHLARPMRNSDGVIDRIYVSGTEVTDRIEAEAMIRVQHEALQQFAACTTPEELASQLLAAALKVNGYDAGGVYLRDAETGGYALVVHKGLSAAFVESSSFFEAGSPHARRIDSAQVGFGPYTELSVAYDEIRWREGIHGLAILPLASAGRTFGSLNLASHNNINVDSERRAVFETLAGAAAVFLDKLAAERRLRDSERHMRESRDHATASEAVKDAMITRISHALRTPLSVVHGITDVLNTLVEQGTASEQERRLALQRLHDSVATLQNVADTLRDLPLLRYGVLAPREEPTDVAALVRDIAETQKDQARIRALDLVTDIPAQPLTLTTDPFCLRQAVLPVIENAMRFTTEGHVAIALAERDDAIEISVTDSGVGIAPEDLDAIFTLFYSRHVASPYKHDGIGLGLPIARMYIEAIGGSIAAESTPGRGSTFRLHLPRQ